MNGFQALMSDVIVDRLPTLTEDFLAKAILAAVALERDEPLEAVGVVHRNGKFVVKRNHHIYVAAHVTGRGMIRCIDA
jgi:hypothetical protein